MIALDVLDTVNIRILRVKSGLMFNLKYFSKISSEKN